MRMSLMDTTLNIHGTILYLMLEWQSFNATVWATNLNSYTVKVDETNGDVLVNPNGKTI